MSTTTTPYGVIVTETEDSISFRLPSWLTDDERARIRTGRHLPARVAGEAPSGSPSRAGRAGLLHLRHPHDAL